SPAAPLLTIIDSVTTLDSATATYWFHARSPQQFYVAVSQLPIMPQHGWNDIALTGWRASAAAKRPIGSGQYRFVRWIPGAAVELAADTANYRGAPKISRLIWSIAPDFNTALTRFLSGETDFFEQLRPENIAEVRKHPELRTRQYHALLYLFAQFTLSVPSTSKVRVRLAVVLQEELRKAGVKVDVEQLDFPVLVEKERKRAFDAAIGQWSTQPSPGAVRGSWGTAGSRTASGNNYGSYENPVFDA